MSNNIFKKSKDAIYVNSANNSESNSISYVNTASSCPKPRYSIKDDSNIFTKSKEALYMQSYSGGRTDSAVVTISKDNIIYVNVDNEHVYKESYLEGNVFYC